MASVKFSDTRTTSSEDVKKTKRISVKFSKQTSPIFKLHEKSTDNPNGINYIGLFVP